MRVIDVPEGLVKWDGEGIGFRRVVYKSSSWWYIPGDSIVATVNVKGSSVDECFRKAEEIVKEVKCSFIEVDWTIRDDIIEDVKKLGEMGEKFRFDVKK
jgi:hypothetical protein